MAKTTYTWETAKQISISNWTNLLKKRYGNWRITWRRNKPWRQTSQRAWRSTLSQTNVTSYLTLFQAHFDTINPKCNIYIICIILYYTNIKKTKLKKHGIYAFIQVFFTNCSMKQIYFYWLQFPICQHLYNIKYASGRARTIWTDWAWWKRNLLLVAVAGTGKWSDRVH